MTRVFIHNRVRLLVKHEPDGLCFGCYFHDFNKGCQKKLEYGLPSCEDDFGTPVIFLKKKTLIEKFKTTIQDYRTKN